MMGSQPAINTTLCVLQFKQGMVPSPQVCVSTLVTVSTMAVVDLYLLEQSMLGGAGWAARGTPAGSGKGRGPGLWSAGVQVGGREPGPAAGFASALWFLFLSLLQLKLFFVCQNYRQERRPPDPLARKTLTLLLSVCLPSLFIIIPTGLSTPAGLRLKQEVRGRLLWVVLDLLDVLDLQAGLWEASTGGAGSSSAPLWAEGLVFFYCYVLLLLLPQAPADRGWGIYGRGGGRREAVYPWLSLVTINVLTLLLRGAGVLWYRDPRVSTIFLGKNLLALAVKLSAAWERRRRQRQQQRPQASGGAVTRRTAGGAGEADGDAGGCGAEGEDERRLDGVGSPGSLPPSRYHTLSRAHSLARVSVNLDHTEAALGPAYISREL
ncbi:transmembrane protein 121 [Alosa alosa]|uniref:transmembrane protein 121 n=1 Tax=Alosa alosa TaxID=278164 RepID=UPI0020152BBE|nr:transmembrane protein 121 [Alosa alosa]